MLTLPITAIVAVLVIGTGTTHYLFPSAKSSQLKVTQDNSGLASASPDNGNADRTDAVRAKTLLPPVPDALKVEAADDQPLMATGLDLAGPPKRFPAKETPGHLGVRAY